MRIHCKTELECTDLTLHHYCPGKDHRYLAVVSECPGSSGDEHHVRSDRTGLGSRQLSNICLDSSLIGLGALHWPDLTWMVSFSVSTP